MRILFMGTPDFALTSLKSLYNSGHEIIGIVTQPDKPKGRGYVMTPPPPKVFAQEKNIPVFQPDTLRDHAFEELLHKLDPELIAVVAYGKILPENVLNYPKYGCINVHGSLLPKYRGAAPIQRAIIDGDLHTGITTMYMAKGLDTGDMLLKATTPICENDNFEDMHDKLAQIGGDLLVQTIEKLQSGEITPEVQDHAQATYAAKIEKEDCIIDFNKTAKEVHNKIRGLSPIPVSFTHTPDEKILKITKSLVLDDSFPQLVEKSVENPMEKSTEKSVENSQAGLVLEVGEHIVVACGVGKIALLEVVPQGKGKMSAGDFVRGRKIAVGDVLGRAMNN